jgi:hypothetical protein
MSVKDQLLPYQKSDARKIIQEGILEDTKQSEVRKHRKPHEWWEKYAAILLTFLCQWSNVGGRRMRSIPPRSVPSSSIIQVA